MLKFHKCTAVFSQTLFDRVALINNNRQIYPLIQQIEAGKFKSPVLRSVPLVEDCYVNFTMTATNKIGKFMEYNGPTNFQGLVQEDANVHVYKKGEYLDTRAQSESDDVFDLRRSFYTDRRVHGMDHKAYDNPPNEVDSKIFSQLSVEKYERCLNIFSQSIAFNLDITKKTFDILNQGLGQLAKSCADIKTHQKVWASIVHHFPNRYLPPMRIPSNFAIDDLKPCYLEEFECSQARMQKVSDYLYKQKVPENDYKKAVEYFEDSVIKQIFEEH